MFYVRCLVYYWLSIVLCFAVLNYNVFSQYHLFTFIVFGYSLYLLQFIKQFSFQLYQLIAQ